jgi:two-component system cell cycle sensor histidine kinase/response regulator CckA
MTARILVIEDDSIVSMEIQYTLESLGYQVAGIASSGQAAIEQAAETRPDLVLMDIKLKGAMDGVEAAVKIGERFDIPVIYLTAYADQDTLRRAKITEPYGYIIKPFEERELHTAIEMAIYKHRMEKRLKESERWLAATLKSIGDAVIATDGKGLVSFMNPVAEALTGWKEAKALGREIADVLTVVDEETHRAVENPVHKALQEGVVVDQARHAFLTQDGQEIPIDHSASPIRDDNGDVCGVVVVLRDITERKQSEIERERLQAQLFQAQRMEIVGVLAAGIAHSFNNLMTTIIGYSSVMLSSLSEKDPLRSGLERIKQAGEQATSLTRQILVLSSRQPSQPRVVDLNIVVIDMKEMLQRLAGEDVDLIDALEPGLGYVEGDPVQLERLIMNLFVNAREAMPEKGRITVKTETVSLDQEACRDHPEAEPGTYVSLSVADTGIGMDEETIEHIFEPFFSTKEKGTGLGLSIAHNIAIQHGGWIEVSSAPGQGSTFRIYLPTFATDPEYEAVAVEPLPEPQGMGERILLVEDDDGVRAAISEMLRTGGYQVTEAATAKQALDSFELEDGNFDLVFSDIILPDQDGIELVDELRAQKPSLAHLLTSGYTDQRSQWPIIVERGLNFVQKPFGLSDLLPIVRQAFVRESSPSASDESES